MAVFSDCAAKRLGFLILISTSLPAFEAMAAEGDERASDAGVAPETSSPEASRSEIDQLRAEVAQLKARMDASEEAAIAQAGGSHFEPTFDVYGYMSVELTKWFVDDDSALQGVIDTNLSFGVNNLNLYFSSHMTETLSALVELGITAMPHGVDKTMVPYERYDNRITDPRTSETKTLGGIIIERAQLAWQPYDFFGVTAGRFLTPFGIWNIDHSPVVVLPKKAPYLMIRQTIPLAQTGVAVQGRFFPAKNTYLDYAVTLSNGRGPTEEVFDLDDEKAIGVRLKGWYEKDRFSISLGAYGFFGTMTDSVKQLVAEPEFGIEIETTEKYKEFAGAADFKLQLYGVVFQAEWAGGEVRYSKRPLKEIPFIDMSIASDEYQPDFLRWDVYGLLAWTLPLSHVLKDKTITLFALGEYSVMDDTDPDYDVRFWRWGVDFKPISYVVIKADFELLELPNSELIRGKAYAVGAQAAVAF